MFDKENEDDSDDEDDGHKITTRCFACIASTLYVEGPYEVSSENSLDEDAQSDYKGLAKRHHFVDSGLPCDPMFCAASLIVELGGEGLFKLLCQLVFHLVQAFEASACPLGLLIYENHFTRLYYVGDGNFFYEVRNSRLWGQTFSLLEAKNHFIGRNDYCAHSLGGPGSGNNPDPEALDAMKQTLCAAVTRLACLPFQGVTYDNLKKHAVPEWLLSDEELRFSCHEDGTNSPMAAGLSGQGEIGDGIHRQYKTVCDVSNQDHLRSSNGDGNVPHTRLSGNVPADGTSLHSSAEETKQAQDSHTVWWDPEDDIDHTPAGDYPVYRVLEHLGVRIRCVSPQDMKELVARYGDSSIPSST